MGIPTFTIPAFAGAENLKVNGWNPLSGQDSTTLLEQAHALTSVIQMSLNVARDGDGLNETITASAMEGLQTILSLAIVASDNEGKQRRRAA